jgi:Flp pilus assembly pilin Flp
MLLGTYVRATTFWHGVKSRFVDERGAVSTEYGLLLVLIALAIVAAATALGVAISGVFNKGTTKLGGVPSS